MQSAKHRGAHYEGGRMATPAKLFDKEAPTPKKLRPHRQSTHIPWLSLLAAPLFFSFFLLSLQPLAPQQAVRQVSVRSLGAAVKEQRTTLGAQPTYTNPCDDPAVIATVKNGDIFPLFPKEIRNFNPEETGCTPALWNRAIVAYLIFKLLALLNWAAGTIAILATIYAGIMYLTGFLNEKGLDTAKSILKGTYFGLLIVVAARLIVVGSFQLFGNVSDSQDLGSSILDRGEDK